MSKGRFESHPMQSMRRAQFDEGARRRIAITLARRVAGAARPGNEDGPERAPSRLRWRV